MSDYSCQPSYNQLATHPFASVTQAVVARGSSLCWRRGWRNISSDMIMETPIGIARDSPRDNPKKSPNPLKPFSNPTCQCFTHSQYSQCCQVLTILSHFALSRSVQTQIIETPYGLETQRKLLFNARHGHVII